MHATAAKQPNVKRYVQCTHKFEQTFPVAFDKLLDQSIQLGDNAELARLLMEQGKIDLAEKIRNCGRIVSSNDPNNMLPNQYCGRPHLCNHCSVVLAQKRQERFFVACERFAEECSRGELVWHSFLVKPSFPNLYTLERVKQQFRMIQTFREFLKRYHATHNYLRLEKTKMPRAKCLRTILGPAITAMHLALPRGRYGQDVNAMAHLHVLIVTPRDYSKRALTQVIEKLWVESCKACERKPNESEVSRTKYRNVNEGQRGGHFKIFDEHCPNIEEFTKFTTYCSQTIKPICRPENIIDIQNVMNRCNIPLRNTHQWLGMMRTGGIRLPGSFPADRLGHRFKAEFNDVSGWIVFRRV